MIIANKTKKESQGENLDTWCYEVGTRFEEVNIEAAKHFEQILSLFRRPKSVTELGCGDGAATNWFFSNGFVIDAAIDINFAKLMKVKTESKRLKDINDYVTEVGLLRNVFAHHSLEHTIDAKDTLKKISQKMTPGDIFYGIVPAEDYLHSVHHIVFESPEELLPPNFIPLILKYQKRLEPEYLCVAMKPLKKG
jgi:hypothetical protein